MSSRQDWIEFQEEQKRQKDTERRIRTQRINRCATCQQARQLIAAPFRKFIDARKR